MTNLPLSSSLSSISPSSIPPNQKEQWYALGAWQAGTVAAVALHGRHGVLASSAGVYGWEGVGADVVPMVQGMSDLDVVAITYAGGVGEADVSAFAATATGRLFKNVSADSLGGGKWQEISRWAGLGVAVVLVASPAYAVDKTLFVGTPTGIFRTQDDGQSWESCNFGLLDEDVLCMACAPNFAESGVLWAGTAGGGLYRSHNSARAWRESGDGLPDAAVQSLAVSPNFSEDHTLYIGMEVHGVYVSRDGGEKWQRFTLEGVSVNSLSCPQPDLLWAGTEDGLWRITTSNGAANQVTGEGEAVLAVAANARGEIALGMFGSGLWLTQNGFDTPEAIEWQKPDVALHAPPVIAKVGSELFGLDTEGFMARGQEAGAAWVEIESFGEDTVYALAGASIDEGNGNRATTLFVATSSGLSRRDGLSQAWDVIARDAFAGLIPLGVSLSPTFETDRTLLIVGDHGELLLSQDGGATWAGITGAWGGQSLLRADFAPDKANEIVALTVQPTDTGHFAVTVWHTDDFGQTWAVLAGLSSGVPAVMLAWPAETAEHAMYLATQHRVVKLFHDNDPTTLQVHQHFFDEALRVTALASAPDYADSHTVWAATTGGIFRSADRGVNWESILELPLGLPVVWLEVTPTHVHAITLGGRVWRGPLP